MDREEILKILSTYDLTEDEKEYFYLQLYFTDQLNNKGDKQIQEFHEEQKENRDSILNEIAKIMLSYPIIDSSMSIGNTDKVKLKSELNTLIQSKIQSEVNSETLKTKDLLESIGKEKINTNNYVESLGAESVNLPLDNEKTLKTPKNTNSSNIPKKIKVGNDDSNESDNSIEDALDEIINKKADNKTWSDRLWNNKNDLQKDLKSEIDNFLNGKTTVNKIEENIKKKYNSNAYETKRLVHTETARVQEEMNQAWSKEHGIKDQMFMATLDYKTSMTCRGFDGKPFEFNDVNKPIPPLHPFCRSTLVNLPNKDWRPKERLDNETKKNISWQSYEEWMINYNNGLDNENKLINIPEETLKHVYEGDFTNPKNPKKIKVGEVRLKGGGHSQRSIELLNDKKIEYNIVKEYSNGVRIGNVPNHKEKAKKEGTKQAWFPENWNDKDIQKSAEYVANLKDKSKYILEYNKDKDGNIISIFKFANYNGVTVGACYDYKFKKITTIFPDETQRMLGGAKNE